MSRLPSAFRRLAKTGELALIPYLPLGLPSLAFSRSLLPVIGRQGADAVALGTWSSLASRTSTGATLSDCLAIATEARRTNEVPLILVVEWEELDRVDTDRFLAECHRCGVDGLLARGLFPASADEVAAALSGARLDFIPWVTSGGNTLSQLTGQATGALYVQPESAAADGVALDELIAAIRAISDLPLISGPADTSAQVSRLVGRADGGLAGEAVSRLLALHTAEDAFLEVPDLVRVLKEAGVPSR